ncbi:VASt domain-containing protein, partial [Balamuthia mandrillaris]
AQNEGIIQELGDIVANGLRCHGSIVEGPWIVNGLENPRWKWLAQSIRKGHWDVLHQAALGLDRGKEVLPPMDSSQQQQPLDATSSQSSSSSSSSSRFYETPTGSWIRNLINAAVYSILKEVPSSDERRNRKGRVFQGSFTREELLLVYRQLPLGLQKLFMLLRAKTIHDSATHEENTRLPPLRQEWLNESSLADALMSSIPSKPTTSSHRTKVQQEMISEGGEEEEEEEEEEGEEQQQQQQQQQQEAVVMEEDPEAFLHPPLDRQQLEQAARMEAMVEKQYSAKEKLFQYRMKLTHYCPPFTVQEALAENALNFASLKSLKGMRISTSINLSGPLEDVKRLMLAVRRCLVKEAQQHNTPLELDPLDRKLWKTRIRHPVRSQLERVWPHITLEKSRKPERRQSKSKSKSSSSSSSSSKSKNKSKASSSSATANMPADPLYNAAAIVHVKDLPELDAISPLAADWDLQYVDQLDNKTWQPIHTTSTQVGNTEMKREKHRAKRHSVRHQKAMDKLAQKSSELQQDISVDASPCIDLTEFFGPDLRSFAAVDQSSLDDAEFSLDDGSILGGGGGGGGGGGAVMIVEMLPQLVCSQTQWT